ncbi:peptidase M16 [Pokkaliibacter plantistimulans]|uniref:Peptidase M16 n=1 Tax=Pokkaliibacter plantistimulans TaxID=1635171 RepID=A0ABX5M687_9GAMM|nr:insulinase family protein [Pokkaliibacter plantistimulans]PXF33233.1 peptidase M16 [Pokkaliibacter plantistimulans]
MMKTHSAFRLIRQTPIASLGIEVAEFEHLQTGSMHYHIASDNEENVFMVAFRTMPMDSTGVAHILEHTALCGSERYPVRDPFFMMTRRSLNTFMNAFTSSDWTAYPFASQNKKDFNNLLDVYLDAAFFSRLDPLDFAQEGHRLEFAEAENPESALEYKGVVFNEMKGAMSSPVSTLWQTLTKYLFPTATYHYNSGGEPACIPDLSYEELLAFYKRHYHPTNAVFMTFGNIDPYEHQEKMHEQALKRFDRLDDKLEVKDEKRYFAPIIVEEAYACNEDDLHNQTHLVMGWLLGSSINLYDSLKANLLSKVLLDHSASPLRHALETCGLGQSPSPLCGLEDSNREISFMCGLEGSNPEQAAAFEQLVLDTLQKLADQGVDQDQVDAALHQLELSQREIGGDGYPYGLQLGLGLLSSAIHRGDPIALLDLDPVLERLREDVKDSQFIPGLINKLLLNNPHRVRLTLRPDAKLAERREQAEKDTLAEIKAGLTDEQKAKLVAQAKALQERQDQIDDADILPKVTLQDVPADMKEVVGIAHQQPVRVTSYDRGTNGIVYQQVVLPLPELNQEQLSLLPYYVGSVAELGVGQKDYMEMQARQAQVSGGLSVYTSLRANISDPSQLGAYLVISGKALARNHQALDELMLDTFQHVRFDEHQRIRELIAQRSSRKRQSVTGSGHSLAMLASAAVFSPGARLAHVNSGLEGIRFIQQLDKKLADEGQMQELTGTFAALHQRFAEQARQVVLVAEGERLEECIARLSPRWYVAGDIQSGHWQPQLADVARLQAWKVNTQVNFCAKAYPTVHSGHADAPILTVLGEYLRNGFLHRVIREQGGAYGGGAGHDAGNGVFRFYSYRDPRNLATLADFDRAIDWVLSSPIDQAKLEEAVLGVVSSLDKPGSPAGEAIQTFHNLLHGRTQEQRKLFRQRVLETTAADLRRVTETYLQIDKASAAVVTHEQGQKQLQEAGFSAFSL